MNETAAWLLRNSKSVPVGITKQGTYVFLCVDLEEQRRLTNKAKATHHKVAFISEFQDPFLESVIRLGGGGLTTYLPDSVDSVPNRRAENHRLLPKLTRKVKA